MRHGRSLRVGLALGVFDGCHEGHSNLLRRAAAHCDRLIVAVHTDAEVLRYKNHLPANSERERQRTVSELGLAHTVVIDSDRERLCRRYGITHVFHGDDWPVERYRERWGEAMLAELGIELVMLPHTPGLQSRQLYHDLPPVGWWLYSPRRDWRRDHIHAHLCDLYAAVGGRWIVGDRGREVVRRCDRFAPCVLLPACSSAPAAAMAVEQYGLAVLVVAHFNYEHLLSALERIEHPLHLVVLSHGRSGKPGTSADHRFTGGSQRRGRVTVHDWSYAADSYLHLDGFLASGGSFDNTIPTGRPRILLLPTWPHGQQQCLLGERWRSDLRKLSREVDLLISPHPLLDDSLLTDAARDLGATILPGTGESYREVPEAHVVVSDLSGAFWEALLFDTPVVLARPEQDPLWPADLPPSPRQTAEVVPFCSPGDLAETVRKLINCRRPGQRALAQQRLGQIDGQATRRVADRIRDLVADCRRAGG